MVDQYWDKFRKYIVISIHDFWISYEYKLRRWYQLLKQLYLRWWGHLGLSLDSIWTISRIWGNKILELRQNKIILLHKLPKQIECTSLPILLSSIVKDKFYFILRVQLRMQLFTLNTHIFYVSMWWCRWIIYPISYP